MTLKFQSSIDFKLSHGADFVDGERRAMWSESTGDTYSNDGSISSLSDVRIKTNIVTLTDGLNIVNQLRPVTFEYTEGNGFKVGVNDKTKYGFIADEVQAVASQYVKEITEKIDGVEVDDFKVMSQVRLIPMLTKAIQELSTKVTALEDA